MPAGSTAGDSDVMVSQNEGTRIQSVTKDESQFQGALLNAQQRRPDSGPIPPVSDLEGRLRSISREMTDAFGKLIGRTRNDSVDSEQDSVVRPRVSKFSPGGHRARRSSVAEMQRGLSQPRRASAVAQAYLYSASPREFVAQQELHGSVVLTSESV